MCKEHGRLALVLGLAVIILTVNLGGYDLWPSDEPRYAQVAREMISSGNYLLPHVNNAPYIEKPPLFFWIIAAFSHLAGDVTPWTTRLPSVMAGIVTLLFTWLLARRMFDIRIAFWSCLILLTMQRFWWNARFGQIDMTLTACLTLGLYAFFRWQESRRIHWLFLFYLGVLVGIYAKGPGVIAFPVLFVSAWSWSKPDRRRQWLHLGAAVVVVMALYALWAVPAHLTTAGELQTDVSDTLAANIFRQTAGRFLLGVGHANWPWYYVKTLPVDWLPWTLFLPWTAWWVWRKRKDSDAVRFLLYWIVPAFVFFTMAIGKRAVYLLPLFPAFAMLFAASILELMDGEHILWRRRTGVALALFLFAIGLAPFVPPFTKYGDLWTPRLLILSAAAWAPALAAVRQVRRNETRRLHVSVAVSFCLLVTAAAITVFPIVNIYKSAKDFCAPVRSLSERGMEFDLYSVGFAREEYLFYSRHFFRELYTEIIPMKNGSEMNRWELAEFQNQVHRSIEKAAAKTTVENIKRITGEEVRLLKEAIREAVGKTGYPTELIAEFQRALKAESDEFFTVFASSRPAFLYVQENDWRWLYAIHPDMRNAHVLHQEQVGSRHVLLVANDAGRSLLQSVKPL
ncbi:MAG TPA: glycosyltransferase family 39 protein [Candidatus Hydrogenedentes bacterium]|nr:glycosyltransferase family 39 protein [Candidatus Hydrogenedentota bacterium]